MINIEGLGKKKNDEKFYSSFNLSSLIFHNNVANIYRIIVFESQELKSNIMFTNIIGNEQKGMGAIDNQKGIITNSAGEMEI